MSKVESVLDTLSSEEQKAIMDKLATFYVGEIGSKALEGVTYAVIPNKEKDKIAFCESIVHTLIDCGVSEGELFRMYPVVNGYIFDADTELIDRVSKLMLKMLLKVETDSLKEQAEQKEKKNELLELYKGLRQESEEIRQTNRRALAKYIKTQFDKEQKTKIQVDVALANRENTIKAEIVGVDTQNNMVMVVYHAFKVLPWEIEGINKRLLMPAGIRISNIKPCEILPRDSVRFTLTVEQVR